MGFMSRGGAYGAWWYYDLYYHGQAWEFGVVFSCARVQGLGVLM